MKSFDFSALSLREEMLAVAVKAPRLLGEATSLVIDFLKSQHAPQGGFYNRAGEADLYYGFFGMECMSSLGLKLDQKLWSVYLDEFGDGPDDDLIHLSCLVRCWANLPSACLTPQRRLSFLRKLENFRSEDGAFNTILNQTKGSAYGCFVALDTYGNLKSQCPNINPLIERILKVKTPTGAFAFDEGRPEGTTPTTAAGLVALQRMNHALGALATSQQWLLARKHKSGGLLAVPKAPMPDLLSTATGYHTLAMLGVDLSPFKDDVLNYIDSLWVNRGGFYAHWSDDTLDVEYLFYALLALGHFAD